VNDFAGEPTTVHFDGTSSFIDDDPRIDGDTDDTADPSEDSADSLDETPRTSKPPLRAREGLPAGFRMRHDAHYVEELTARPSQPERRQLAVSDVDARATDERENDAADWPLVARLEALGTQVESATRRGFRSAAAIDAFRVDLARAIRIARAGAIVTRTVRLQRREITAAQLARQVFDATRTMCRTAGVQIESIVDAPAFRVPVDAALMAQALEGSIDALLAQLEEGRESDFAGLAAPHVRLRLSGVTTRPALLIELSQDACALPPEAVSRFFDASFEGHAGGPSTGVLLSAAARIVRLHGGRADVRRDGDVGSTITFVVPQAPARA
jgi:signal transduction histidine kinase